MDHFWIPVTGAGREQGVAEPLNAPPAQPMCPVQGRTKGICFLLNQDFLLSSLQNLSCIYLKAGLRVVPNRTSSSSLSSSSSSLSAQGCRWAWEGWAGQPRGLKMIEETPGTETCGHKARDGADKLSFVLLSPGGHRGQDRQDMCVPSLQFPSSGAALWAANEINANGYSELYNI